MICCQSGDHRPHDGRYTASVCRLLFDKMASTDRLTIVGRLTPDDRATFGRYHDKKIFKISANFLPINGQPLSDASPMTTVNETFNLSASTKKIVGRPKNLPKSVPTSAYNRPMSPDFPIFPIFGSPTVLSDDRLFG